MDVRAMRPLVNILSKCQNVCQPRTLSVSTGLSCSLKDKNLLDSNSNHLQHARSCASSCVNTVVSGRPNQKHDLLVMDYFHSLRLSLGCVRTMAGHSKWANIKHIKAAKDNEKAKTTAEFTRKMRAFMRETGQVDPKTSSQLAKMIADAKKQNIPSANIDKILAHMTSMKNAPPTILEAKGPAGSLMLAEVVSSKINHTKSELQSMVKKCGFSFMGGGSMAHVVFEEKGIVLVECPDSKDVDVDKYVDVAIEAGAEDVELEDDEDGRKVLQFKCERNDVYAVKKELEAQQMTVKSADVVFLSLSQVPLDSMTLEALAKAIDRLEEHPDVLKVYTNAVEMQ